MTSGRLSLSNSSIAWAVFVALSGNQTWPAWGMMRSAVSGAPGSAGTLSSVVMLSTAITPASWRSQYHCLSCSYASFLLNEMMPGLLRRGIGKQKQKQIYLHFIPCSTFFPKYAIQQFINTIAWVREALPTAIPASRARPVTTVLAHPAFASRHVSLSKRPLSQRLPAPGLPRMAALGSSFSSAAYFPYLVLLETREAHCWLRWILHFNSLFKPSSMTMKAETICPGQEL